MEATKELETPNSFRRIANKLEGPYWIMLGLFVILVAAAFILDHPRNIRNGLIAIVQSRSILVTDYAALGGMGAMLVSSVLVGAFSMITMIIGGVKPTGGTLMGLWLILGFAFLGKNLANTIPIVFGVWLYSAVKKMPFKDVAVTSMLCACIAPIVSEVAHVTNNQSVLPELISHPFLGGMIVGTLVGIFVGFIFAPLAAAMGKVHGGYLLYNGGFVGGLIATFAVSIMRGAGFEIGPMRIWTEAYTVPLAILMYIVSLFFIVAGIVTSGRDRWERMRKINKHSGRLLTDYYELYGNVAYLNMGLLCALGTTVTLLVGAPINGGTMGGIFCVVGFGALGKNFRNVIPIMIGTTLGAFLNIHAVSEPSNIFAILFGTGIAPLAGKFGLMWGIVCGFVHVNLVWFVGLINGGLNLYNNGFAGGFVVIFMIPIMTALSRNKEIE